MREVSAKLILIKPNQRRGVPVYWLTFLDLHRNAVEAASPGVL